MSHFGVLGDCFLIHMSELRLDVVSVKTLRSTVINPEFLLLEVWLHVHAVLALKHLEILVIQEVSMNTYIPSTSFLTGSQEESRVTGFPVLVRCPLFYLGLRFLLVHATGFPVLPHSYYHCLLILDTRFLR